MRRILSQEDREKQQQRNKIILGVFLVIIMAFSTVGYAFYYSPSGRQDGSTANSLEYGGVEFVQLSNGRWGFILGGTQYQTAFNPSQTEDIPVILTKSLSDYLGQILYFGADSAENLSQGGNQELLLNLNSFISRSNPACLTEACTEDYPLKSCSQDNIIIFELVEENPRVIENERCVQIYTPSFDAERASDAFLFRILGIQ